jgi:class 3 adenylate cyclase
VWAILRTVGRDERGQEGNDGVIASELVAILFTDVVGSTARAAEVGEAAADELRSMHLAHLREAIAATAGTEAKTIGDAIVVSYGGAADAVTGAVAMQRAVERHNRHLDGHEIQMRVGVSVGDATFEDGDWFGTPVIEAARLCAAAEGRQILVNDVVHTLAGSRNEFEVHLLGARELKGLPDPAPCVRGAVACAARRRRIPFPSFVGLSPTFSLAGVPVSSRRSAQRGRRYPTPAGGSAAGYALRPPPTDNAIAA